eukprot:3604647-Pleurochrysis_carterae.AAC.2
MRKPRVEGTRKASTWSGSWARRASQTNGARLREVGGRRARGGARRREAKGVGREAERSSRKREEEQERERTGRERC